MAPAASISSRTIWLALCSTRRPRGRYVYAPAPSWRIMPARSKRIWLGATASAGVSLSVGIRAFDQRTGSILLGNRGKPFLLPVRTRQAASHRGE